LDKMLAREGPTAVSESQRRVLEWAMACTLHAASKYAEAVPYFERLAAGSDKYAGEARPYLIESLAWAGRLDEARQRYEWWLAQDRPRDDQAKFMSKLIRVAEKRHTQKLQQQVRSTQ